MQKLLIAVLLWSTEAWGGPGGDSAVTLVFGGDCLLADHYERYVGDSVAFAFEGFTALQQADIAMVNLECPVTTRGIAREKPFTFRMHPRFAPALVAAGIDIVNLANNHIFDFGEEGLFDTIDILDSLRVAHVGAGRTAAGAHRGVIVTVRDRRIGFLGYYGGGESPRATAHTPGVAARELSGLRGDIARMRQQDSVNYVVVNFHWGDELAAAPSPSQVRFGRATIDAGADAVIGHHPHVLQGIEYYHHGVIVYSLGNLVFGGNSRSSSLTALFQIHLYPDRSAYTVLPVRVDHWRLSIAQGDEAQQVMNLMIERSQSFPRTIFNEKEQ